MTRILDRALPLAKYAIVRSWASPVTWVWLSVTVALALVRPGGGRSRAVDPAEWTLAVALLTSLAGASMTLLLSQTLLPGVAHLRRSGMCGRLGAALLLVVVAAVTTCSPASPILIAALADRGLAVGMPVRIGAGAAALLLPGVAIASMWLVADRLRRLDLGRRLAILLAAVAPLAAAGFLPPSRLLVLLATAGPLSAAILLAATPRLERWGRTP